MSTKSARGDDALGRASVCCIMLECVHTSNKEFCVFEIYFDGIHLQ